MPPILAVLFGLIVSATTRLNATVLGQPVSVPALWLIAAAVVLALAVLVLWLLCSAVCDGGFLQLRPRRVNAP
jgi:hypothetical protein